MNKNIKTDTSFRLLFVAVLFLFSTSLCVSQTFENEEDEVEIELEDEVIEGNATTIFNALGIDNIPNPLNENLIGSQVFLQQIGDFNDVNISVSAAASDISVVQNGNLNNTFLNYQVQTVITDIIQNGDGNVLSDFVIDPQENISLEVQQQGNFLTFERFGSNELTKSLRFIQTEASPSIIVRSFN